MARREQTAGGPGSRALIVDLVRSAGRISRVELTELTGLTQPAVSGIVRKLLSDGVLRETGAVTSTRGKPRSLLELNSRIAYGIGMHVSAQSITCVATDTLGGVIARRAVARAADDDPAEQVARLYAEFVGGVGLEPSDVVGLAVAVPGPVGPASHGVPDDPAAWSLSSLRARLDAVLGIPVLIDNDASLAAVGEFWSRNISRTSSFAAVYMNDGIGAGVVVDGALLRGASSNTAELGHISVEPNGIACYCGNVGCLERYASPAAIAEAVRGDPDWVRGRTASSSSDLVVFDELARAAVTGDERAKRHLDTAANRLAQAILTLTNLFDLDRIVLAGAGFAVAGSIFVRATQDALDHRGFARMIHSTKVELAIDPRDSAAIGAASVVLQDSVAPGHSPTSR